MSRVELLPEGEQHMLDRYQLIGEIAAGGMATVFLARLPGVGGFQRLVAIKRLHPHLAHEPEFVEMFLDEARLAASIHHRNVVPILEIGTSSGGYYLVMEYIEGVTLARLMTQAGLKDEPLPRAVLLRVVIDTLSGLHAAHEVTDEGGKLLGVVHRDCSPQNILIGVDGCTRITDFGIARASSRLHNTREGALKGKLAYMAPEQTQGEAFDRRADLFSVGVVLWEVLSLRRLFKGKTEAQTLRRLLHDDIPKLERVVPSIHPALSALCVKALDREPDKRFQTAAAMADAIERAAREACPDDPLASERQVEALMKERYNADVLSQRDELRAWLQATPSNLDQDAPTTARGLGATRASSPGASRRRVPPSGAKTRRGWPIADEAEESRPSRDEDDTHIYDPTSTTGVTAERDDEPWPPPDADPGRGVEPRRRGGRARLLVTLGALAAAATAAVLALEGGSPRATSGPAAGPAPVQSAPPRTSATALPTATPAPAAPPPQPVAPPRAPPSATVAATTPKAVPKAVPKATAPSGSSPSGSSTAASKTGEGDDLANPYR